MDPYAVLGVARNAPVDEIRQAYVDLARRNHPDVHGDQPEATEQMRQINLAWEVLSDVDSRAAVDRRLSRRSHGHTRPAEPGTGGRAPFDQYVDDDFTTEGFDGDDRPLSHGELPGWMRLGAPAALVAGVFAVTFGVMVGAFLLVRLGVVSIGLSAVLFLLSPFAVLLRSRSGPSR